MININNKRWDKVRAADVKKVLDSADDETFFFEFKSDDEEPAKLVKEISALSNTYGGYIFLGVNNDKSVGGCKKWTEQRIHVSIHDSLTPTPNFAVRKFKIDGKTVLVIRVEEGTMPPYITGKGSIYERLSSGSFPIKDSAKLTNLYNKRADQISRVRTKIELPEIELDLSCPANLCGYIDLGFAVVCSEPTYLQKHFYSIDIEQLASTIKPRSSQFSISRVGNAYMISVGKIEQSGPVKLVKAGLQNFITVYDDGSAKCRVVLPAINGSNEVEISALVSNKEIYQDIFSKLCGDNFSDIFIHAQKYERLSVLRQFIPRYRFEDNPERDEFGKKNPFSGLLLRHQNKYGDNLIIESNRIPTSDYSIIDRRWFDSIKVKFTQENLIEELFRSSYIHLGYIDFLDVN